ncbi:DUF2238 domain-containing protein [Undibacterium pigrum]|uniref:Putative membrane protein n=1 Tax=Undibacterium pigrum TaxID=401470 RepID=A0A318JBT0_9BURK|nr:DUF2238 domain-containing protein [Undibacterium pigrum]PXX37912.1 putative membrane protein [Undibacterium pigrum]
MTHSKSFSFIFALAVFALSWIKPVWPYEQALHSSLTVLGFIGLCYYARKYPISDTSFLLICLFIAAHCVAARWLYSNVPYDAWIKSLTGFSLQASMDWKRNHFDRLIHFLYGFCLVPALIEYFQHKYTPRLGHCMTLALAAIMVSSLCYEWFEWLIAITMTVEDAEAYNGQQGDIWDAHKDMLAATLGALVWVPVYRYGKKAGEWG